MSEETTKSPEEKKTRKARVKKEDIVITPSTEITPVDNITQELEKQNVTEEALLMMETEFPKLEIRDVHDKSGYKEVYEARIMCKNTRTLTTKVCKAAREEAIRTQKNCIKKENEIVDRIQVVEDILAAKQKVIDDLKDAEKLAKDTLEQSRLQKRAVQLIQAGCTLDGDIYILDDIRISTLSVKQSDDFVWTTLFAAVETRYKEVLEVKAREEQLRLEAESANKKILEEALAREEANKLKEAEIAAREKAIADAEAKAKLDAENKIREEELALKRKAEQELERIEKEAQERLRTRKSALFQLGFSQQADKLVFHSIHILEKTLVDADAAEWSKNILIWTEEVHKAKALIEKERAEREEKIRADAILAEKKRAEEEAQADAVAAQEKKEAVEKEALRIAAAAPDLEKFNNYCKILMSVPVPEFTSPAYKTFTEIIKADVVSILKTLHSKKPQ